MESQLTLDFKIEKIDKHKNLIRLHILPTTYNYYSPISSEINKIICFNYLDKEDDKKYTTELVRNNEFFEVCSFTHYIREYGIVMDLTEHKNLKEKINSLDYKLDVKYVIDDKYFIITLIYTPNLRKLKIEKIKEKIKENDIQ